MKEDHVNQHIAPQAYLRRFAERDRDKYIIGVWQKGSKDRKQKLFLNSVENVGYIKRFYDVSTRSDKKYWEKYYAENIDSLYGTPLDAVIARIVLSRHEEYKLTDEEKQLLSTIISSQMLRTPRTITKSIDLSPQLLQDFKMDFLAAYKGRLSADQEKKIWEKQYTEDEYKDIILSHINDENSMVRYTSILKNRLWCIYINNTDFPFVTSDCPVLHVNLFKNSLDDKDIGIARLDTTLILALTPRIMLQLLPWSLRTGKAEKLNGRIRFLGERELKFILNYNTLQLENCYQQAFMTPEMLETLQAGKQFAGEQKNNQE